MHQSIRDYANRLPDNDEVEEEGYASPCWEMGSHDAFTSVTPGDREDADQARIPKELNEAVMMATMLLPGTVIIYYGDEIGKHIQFTIFYNCITGGS